MSVCSIHKLPNNRYGYCAGCERDPNITIKKCYKCGSPYATHKNNPSSSNLCNKCLLESTSGKFQKSPFNQHFISLKCLLEFHLLNRVDGLAVLAPNPFNGLTRVSYILPLSDNVDLKLYDLSGRLVKVLFEGAASAGTNRMVVDAHDLPTGIYIVILTNTKTVHTKKLVLLK